jgi:ribonuclease PH
MNVVMRDDGHFIELQGTAERDAFDRDLMNQMLDLAEKGCSELVTLQKKALDLG